MMLNTVIMAIAIGLGASAAAQVAAAKVASNAAKKAAATQAAAGEKGLQAEREGYQQQRTDFNPYREQGTAALGNLSRMAGQYTGGPAPTGGWGAAPPAQPPGPPQGPPQGPPGRPQMGQLGNAPPPSGGPQMSGGAPPMSGGPMAPGGGGGMVRVQAPNGEIAMLPMAQAQQAVQKGARIMPGPMPSGGPAPQAGPRQGLV